MDSFLGAYERENKIVWGRVDELEAEEKRLKARIEHLETALQEIAWIATPDHEEARQKATEIARKALEGKNE